MIKQFQRLRDLWDTAVYNGWAMLLALAATLILTVAAAPAIDRLFNGYILPLTNQVVVTLIIWYLDAIVAAWNASIGTPPINRPGAAALIALVILLAIPLAIAWRFIFLSWRQK